MEAKTGEARARESVDRNPSGAKSSWSGDSTRNFWVETHRGFKLVIVRRRNDALTLVGFGMDYSDVQSIMNDDSGRRSNIVFLEGDENQFDLPEGFGHISREGGVWKFGPRNNGKCQFNRKRDKIAFYTTTAYKYEKSEQKAFLQKLSQYAIDLPPKDISENRVAIKVKDPNVLAKLKEEMQRERSQASSEEETQSGSDPTSESDLSDRVDLTWIKEVEGNEVRVTEKVTPKEAVAAVEFGKLMKQIDLGNWGSASESPEETELSSGSGEWECSIKETVSFEIVKYLTDLNAAKWEKEDLEENILSLMKEEDSVMFIDESMVLCDKDCVLSEPMVQRVKEIFSTVLKDLFKAEYREPERLFRICKEEEVNVDYIISVGSVVKVNALLKNQLVLWSPKEAFGLSGF